MTQLSPWGSQFQCPRGPAQSTLSPLTHYLEQQDVQSAFREKHLSENGGAIVGRPRGLRLQVESVLHATQSHADLRAQLHCPACSCYVTPCTGADPGQY